MYRGESRSGKDQATIHHFMRRNRDFLSDPNAIVHVSNWGVNYDRIFLNPQDYDFFLQLLYDAQKIIAVSVLAYSLLPTRFDLVLQQHTPSAISLFMKKVCQAYAEMLNRRLNRSGHVFSRRYTGVPVPDADTLVRLSHDIHMSPVQAGLARRPEQWKYCSCSSYMSKGSNSLADRSLIWGLTGGPDLYARFMGQFDCAAPPSVKTFFSREAADVWADFLHDDQKGKKSHEVEITGARSGPGPPGR